VSAPVWARAAAAACLLDCRPAPAAATSAEPSTQPRARSRARTTLHHPTTLHTTAPWLTKLANAALTGKLVERQRELAADAVDNLEKLGPTFIKLGAML
jgi:predicted unusual protein kinase regulating ubiquinone biosynthesis (AarF/ABC1/UbiB family)